MPRITQIEFGSEPEKGGWDMLWMPKTLFNPGSVGQPRGGDPRASYGIINIADDGKISLEYHRVKYPISRTQDAMRTIGLSNGSGFSHKLIERLDVGR